MFDYKANPFYLNDNEIKWVEDTYEGHHRHRAARACGTRQIPDEAEVRRT